MSASTSPTQTLPEPDFIARDPQAITAEMVAQYETLTGKTLYPAQVERLLIDLIAYRETLVRIGIQEAAKQNLVAFAVAPMLDYLGELVGVYRLPAQAARTVLRFAVDAPLLANLLIPAETLVEGAQATFVTDEDALLLAGQTSVDVLATCDETGTSGNGWQTGQINRLVDELDTSNEGDRDAEVAVRNLTVTSGGADAETDARLRERIKLAPESFTVAGPVEAYRFHALRAHQSIVDVAVLSPVPGTVHLYPLVASGLPDANILARVAATCSAERTRPLCDTVLALPPKPRAYALSARVTLLANVDAETVMQQVMAAAKVYVADRAAGLGRDIVPSAIDAALSLPGVYRVEHALPLIALAEDEWASCSGIDITLAGVANG